MVDHTSRLPDEVVSDILSLLTVGDAVRARLSSSRWLRIPDSRSVLQFDSPNVLGNPKFQKDGPSPRSTFVAIVNRYLELWAGKRISKLVVHFSLGNRHYFDIDRWIATSIAMGVEEIDIDSGIEEEKYGFPSYLLWFGKAPYLKRLSLRCCKLSLSSQCRSWLSNLTTLELTNVPLDKSGWQHILCAGSNLISLVLSSCELRRTLFIGGQLPHLKKFIANDNRLDTIELNCPNLEEFRYAGDECILYFADVPSLREVSVWYYFDDGIIYSSLFDHVTSKAPQLQTLSLWITSEVQPPRATLTSCNLKRLNLDKIPIGFDLLTITDMLNASPSLETLQIELDAFSHTRQSSQRREYPDCLHFHLKEVKIKGFGDQWNGVEFAMYTLRNAVKLEQMVIEVQKGSKAKQKATTLLKKIHSTAEVIILSCDYFNLNLYI